MPRLIFCQQMQSQLTRPPGRAASPTATATHAACILYSLSVSRGSEITRETEHLQSNWPGHHLSEGAQIMLERTATPLAKLFALCFHTGVQPVMWKTANVVPIHKHSAKAAVCNYRPVSLPSVMSKVRETIINKQLMNYLNRHELLTTRQFGFRKGLGTADLLTALHHEWATTVSRGGLITFLAIDIAGAFN